MFPIVKTVEEFIAWVDATESHLANDPRISFVVAFVSFERYFRRLTTPRATPTRDADGRAVRPPKMYDLWARLEQSYGADPTRWTALDAALARLKVDGERLNGWRDLRNGIVHGEHEMKKSEISGEAKAVWRALRILAEHPRRVSGIDEEWSAFSRRPQRNPPARTKKEA
jgi:hypothetical protein